MSSIYVPVNVDHGSFVLPSDGDPAVAESVNDALRDLADSNLFASTLADSAFQLASQAVNGTTGGTYAPTAAITLTSNGIALNGSGANLLVSGLSQIQVVGSFIAATSGVSILDDFDISGPTFVVSSATNTTFLGGVVIEELTTGTSFQANGEVTLGNSSADTVIVPGTTTFEAGVTFEGPVVIDQLLVGTSFQANGTVQLGNGSGDQITLVGTTTLQEPLEYSGNGRVPYREAVMLPNASATINITDGDLFVVPYNITGARVYTLSTSGAISGDRIAIHAAWGAPVTFSFTVTIACAGQIAWTAGTYGGAELVFITNRSDGLANGWYPVAFFHS